MSARRSRRPGPTRNALVAIRYYTGWAKMKEAHRDDLLARLQELVANPINEEDKPYDE